jgi:hypothetical protein
MIPGHVVTLISVLIALWALFRWGSLILALYGLWYFWNEQWGFAALCFVFACVIQAIKAPAILLNHREVFNDNYCERRDNFCAPRDSLAQSQKSARTPVAGG